MMVTRTRIVALLIAATAATGYGYQQGGVWPPGVRSVPEDAPVLSPEAAMNTFIMPPGYRLELVASEPMIEEPILIDWDPDGRLWVLEQRGYMRDLQATDESAPLGRVSVLEDTNGDGAMDRKTVFMDGLVQPRALRVLDRGVLVGEPPNLWLARDTNGDLVADTKELVVDTYGTAMANVEHNANGLTWALDNWIHTSEHNGYLRLRNRTFEYRPTLARGQWGVSQDDAGRLYRNTNEQALFVDLVPARYFMRNPALLRTRGSYESLQNPDINVVWPARPTRGVNRGYQDGILRPDGSLVRFTAVCAPTVYRGDRLPAELHGNVFLAEPAGNLVSRLIVEDDGTGLRSKKAYERGEFLASTDERFRPVYLSNAPDGTLYVVDAYHGIIQHKGYITEYLRDQILARRLDRPSGHGRIYRVVHETTKRDTAPALSKQSAAQLVRVLAHPNGWRRDTAQRLLVERGDRSVVPALRQQAERAPDWRTRLHALWTLDGLDAIEPATVRRALEDASRDVRVSALQLAERWLGRDGDPLQAAVLAKMEDGDWAVRRQLAATIGALPAPARDPAAVALLERWGTDPVTVDAVLSGLAGAETAILDRLLQAPEATPARSAAIAMLAATAVKGGREPAVQQVLGWTAEERRAPWQRQALLGGLEGALLGGPLPGNPPPRQAPSAAAVNAPGGRGGPGGARAFPDAVQPAGGRGRGGAPVSLAGEPAPFAALAAAGGEMGARVSKILERLTWPGKPPAAGAAPAAAALTPAEEKLRAEGQAVYASLCAACHQEDGRGREKLAPPLAGSSLTLAPPEIPIRILLQGKEGEVGLMPPLGSSLSDAQVAAVLTFVRRQWGNGAPAVGPDTVAQVRAATAGRTRPWTNQELQAAEPAARPGRP